MKKNNNIAIICCYGHLNDEKDIAEVQGIKKYLDKISNDIILEDIKTVIISGGYSDDRFDNAESQTYYNYLKQNHPNIKFLIEAISLNHSEHITFSIIQSRKLIKSSTKFIIYCGNNFFNKTSVLAKNLIPNSLSYEIKQIEYIDKSPLNNENIQTIEKLPTELNSEKFQFLKQLLKTSLTKNQ